jgi:hypothetical protein
MWFLKAIWLRNRFGQLTFKVRNYTQSNLQECRESIKEEFATITSKLPAIKVRLDLKDLKEIMHLNYRDALGEKQEVKPPIFTQDELVKFTQNMNIYRILLVLLVFFESILYSLMASLFIRRQSLDDYAGIEYIFGFAFALIFVAALHFAFKNMWEFIEAKHLIEKNKYDKLLLKPFYIKLILAVVIFVIFVVTNIYTGYIRAIILEPGATSSSSFLDKIHGPLLVFSIAITFIVALVMALLEKEITDKAAKYKVYLNWKKQQKEKKEYDTQVRNMLKTCNERRDLLIEKYWGIILDSQRVFKVLYDDDKKELYEELQKDISEKKVDLKNLDDETYQKYLDVAGTRLELFKYGVEIDAGIRKTITSIHDIMFKINKLNESNQESDDSEIESSPD